MKHILTSAALVGAIALFSQQDAFGQQVPRPAPSWWAARTLDHKALTLQQYKGKNVVLAFLLTT